MPRDPWNNIRPQSRWMVYSPKDESMLTLMGYRPSATSTSFLCRIRTKVDPRTSRMKMVDSKDFFDPVNKVFVNFQLDLNWQAVRPYEPVDLVWSSHEGFHQLFPWEDQMDYIRCFMAWKLVTAPLCMDSAVCVTGIQFGNRHIQEANNLWDFQEESIRTHTDLRVNFHSRKRFLWFFHRRHRQQKTMTEFLTNYVPYSTSMEK